MIFTVIGGHIVTSKFIQKHVLLHASRVDKAPCKCAKRPNDITLKTTEMYPTVQMMWLMWPLTKATKYMY